MLGSSANTGIGVAVRDAIQDEILRSSSLCSRTLSPLTTFSEDFPGPSCLSSFPAGYASGDKPPKT
jgi:hypothetical protein